MLKLIKTESDVDALTSPEISEVLMPSQELKLKSLVADNITAHVSALAPGNEDITDSSSSTASSHLASLDFDFGTHSSVPANKSWEGEYGFKVIFENESAEQRKTRFWTYSSALHKLFATANTAVPICIQVSKRPPEGSLVKAMAVYASDEDAGTVVKRCLYHSQKVDPSNMDASAPPDHLIRCDNRNSMYMTDPKSGRHFVICPYQSPHEGTSYTIYPYRFMCLGTCSGGINRRPINIILSLMHNHQCLGRYILPVRVCACPIRDRLHGEKKILPRDSGSRRQHLLKRKSSPKQSQVDSDSGSDSEEAEFILKVKGRTTYEILSRLNDALQMTKLLTPKQVQLYTEQKAKIKSK